jgi:hypothetical protein
VKLFIHSFSFKKLGTGMSRNIYKTEGISGFLDFIHRPVFERTRRFGNWICFRPQLNGGKETPIQLSTKKELISITGQLLSNLHNCLNTSDQDNSAGDNKEYTIKIAINHAHAWN